MYKKITKQSGLPRSYISKIWLIMRMTTFLLFVSLMQVSASGLAQKISLSETNTPLIDVFKEIRQQSGYDFIFTTSTLNDANPVSIKVENADLSTVLEQIFAGQPLEYALGAESVVVKRKTPTPANAVDAEPVHTRLLLAYEEIRGRVVDTLGNPLPGASVRVKGFEISTKTDRNGDFVLRNVPENGILEITYVGYQRQEIAVRGDVGTIVLRGAPAELQAAEVIVNTGYQEIPKERATGAFSYISNEMLNRSVGPDIITRLEGITNGLQFDRTGATGENNEEFRLESRGRATIFSESSPLIVVDNFPYEGNIRDINPYDVESITLLRDASAASIWGAKAGNGVIVIVTKHGRYNRKTQISYNHNTSIIEKPDLFHSPVFLSSERTMEIEREKVALGHYTESETTSLSPYVELLIKKRDDLISDEDFLREETRMKNTDVRHQALKYLYQRPTTNQHNLSVSGGSNVNRYYFSLGYDKSKASMVGDGNTRLTLGLNNTFKPYEDLEITGQLFYTSQRSEANGINLTSIGATRLAPYLRFVDEEGNPTSILKTHRQEFIDEAEERGYLPWNYIPLEEMALADNTSKSNQMRMIGSVRYRFLEGFSLEGIYQFDRSNQLTRRYYDERTYFVRNLVNRYTQTDGTKPIPYGNILEGSSVPESHSHFGRLLLNGNRKIGLNHEITILGGAEIRESVSETSPGYRLYDYDPELGTGRSDFDYTKVYTLPGGSGTIPGASSNFNTDYRIDRFLSYFGNASYVFRDKYILTGSARWDASNLFGVKTNQKGTPLWSAGFSWELSKESFFTVDPLHYLRLRLTYGSSGNVNKDVSTYPIIRYYTGSFLDADLERYARFTSPGNPLLRWERVNTVNVGVDFGIWNGRVSGSVEYFKKYANDLIGDAYLPPSSGINSSSSIRSYRHNYASMQTHGVDIQINTQNVKSSWDWQTTFLLNYAQDKVTGYYNNMTTRASRYFNESTKPLIEGRPFGTVYALPWHGLDNEGRIIAYKNGARVTDYSDYYTKYDPDDLLIAGTLNAPWYGSALNTVGYKGFQFSVLVSWKAGYVYRRESIYPGEEYGGFWNHINYHQDLLKKWEKPGDEHHTYVPKGGVAEQYDGDYDTGEAGTFHNSEVLISRGDHVALQDMNLSYTFTKSRLAFVPFESVRFYLYGRNLGYLWKADKSNLDPITPNARYPLQKHFAFGVQATF